jgi:hypothetical protein
MVSGKQRQAMQDRAGTSATTLGDADRTPCSGAATTPTISRPDRSDLPRTDLARPFDTLGVVWVRPVMAADGTLPRCPLAELAEHGIP